MSREADASIALKKIDETTYSLDPFPFAQDAVTFACRGRYMQPIPVGRQRTISVRCYANFPPAARSASSCRLDALPGMMERAVRATC